MWLCPKVKISPKLNSDVQLHVSLFSEKGGSSPSECSAVKVTHLPEVTLYIKYPSDYPSRSPPTFHISSCWLDPVLPQKIKDRLLEFFVPDCPVVYEWVLFIQDELVELYSKAQQLGQSLNRAATKEKEKTVDGAVDGCLNSEDPCRIFLRSSSLMNDVEEFDSYQKHREFQETEHECGICCLVLTGDGMCGPCERCGLLYCKDCLKGYCQVSQLYMSRDNRVMRCSHDQMCIDEGKIAQLICPERNCSAELTDVFLKSALDEDLFERYLSLSLSLSLCLLSPSLTYIMTCTDYTGILSWRTVLT